MAELVTSPLIAELQRRGYSVRPLSHGRVEVTKADDGRRVILRESPATIEVAMLERGWPGLFSITIANSDHGRQRLLREICFWLGGDGR